MDQRVKQVSEAKSAFINRAELQLSLDYQAAIKALADKGVQANDMRRLFALGVKVGIETLLMLEADPNTMELYSPRPASGDIGEHFQQAMAQYCRAADAIINAS